MTSQRIALVRESFAKIVPASEQAAALFYDRLFAVDPIGGGALEASGFTLLAFWRLTRGKSPVR